MLSEDSSQQVFHDIIKRSTSDEKENDANRVYSNDYFLKKLKNRSESEDSLRYDRGIIRDKKYQRSASNF